MNKRAVEKWLSGALDGELTPDQRAGVQRWLADHPEAADLQAAWERVGDLARRPVATPDPDAAWLEIRRRIRTGTLEAVPETAPVPVFSWRMAWAAAMLALVSLGVFLLAGHQLRRGTLISVRPPGEPAEVEYAESSLPGATMMIFADQETGMTVIWMDVETNGNGKDLEGS